MKNNRISAAVIVLAFHAVSGSVSRPGRRIPGRSKAAEAGQNPFQDGGGRLMPSRPVARSDFFRKTHGQDNTSNSTTRLTRGES